MEGVHAINQGIMDGDLNTITTAVMFMRHCLHYSPQRIQKYLEFGLELAARRYDMCHDIETGKVSSLTEEYKEEFGKKKFYLKNLIKSGETFRDASQMAESFLPFSPKLSEENGIIGIGTIINHHFIGRTFIQQKLRFSGFLCYELGSKLKANDFIEAAKEKNLDVIGVSLMAQTSKYKPWEEFKKFIDRLDSTNLEKKVQIIVGGKARTEDSYLSHPRVHKIENLDLLAYHTSQLIKKARE